LSSGSSAGDYGERAARLLEAKMRAAQYLPMSTEHQQFSIEDQTTMIAEYATSHDFEVVYTYSDEARSGIDLAHRPGLKQLLDDITNGKPDFGAVLVYDVSRWGRFQDADESACYEFLCRRTPIANVLRQHSRG
jgi:DNA invertase Pin-like site-specific DNA recombinase